MFKHDHRWHFLQARTEIEPYNDLDPPMYKKVEYAYFVCNDCPDTDGEPNTIKRIVKNASAQE